ncbi:MAG: ABC transporter substrate-binding protein, partial [Firmicutes bacterium]|nr:ABC transporter substrate-binding protein [Bacillota bacterium]
PEINKAIYHGFAPPQYGPVPSLPKSVFFDPALSKPTYPYDPAKGKKLLEKHGFTMKNGVMTSPKGVPLSFTMLYSSGSNALTDMVELMQQGWAKEGIKMTPVAEPFDTIVGDISSTSTADKWDAASGIGISYGGSYPTGESLFEPGSSSMDTFGYNNSQENALIAATHQPYANNSESLSHYFKYETYTAKQLPVLWNNNAATLLVTAPTVTNVVKYSNSITDMPQMQYWSAAKAK